MKKMKLYIAATIDHYIAASNGDLDWLTGFPPVPENDYGYKELLDSVDVIVMGGQTYREILAMDVAWPYKGKKTYVVSRHPATVEKGNEINFITGDVEKAVSRLKEGNGLDIWLVGGGRLTSSLLGKNLIDEMHIIQLPILLGSGIPLFPPNYKESNWSLSEVKSFENGIVMTIYQYLL